jgi:hypothetical protein
VCAYASTPNKAVVRALWDRGILQQWCREIGRPLSYFGLPGPDIHDLVDWRDLLANERTGVESKGRSAAQQKQSEATISRLLANVSVRAMSSDFPSEGFELLVADVEDVLIGGADTRGKRPRLPRYDLFNLDFDGGFGFAGRDPKRPRAIRKLFERQRGHSFVLLLTINVRDTLGSEVDDYLAGLQQRATSELESTRLDWFAQQPPGQRVLRLLPVAMSFVRDAGETEGFSVFSLPAVTYVGHERARMIHFAFYCTANDATLRTFSSQQFGDVLRLPILEVAEGSLKLLVGDADDLERHLTFLAPDAVKKLVST